MKALPWMVIGSLGAMLLLGTQWTVNRRAEEMAQQRALHVFAERWVASDLAIRQDGYAAGWADATHYLTAVVDSMVAARLALGATEDARECAGDVTVDMVWREATRGRAPGDSLFFSLPRLGWSSR